MARRLRLTASLLLVFVALCFAIACSAANKLVDITVVDEQRTLADGARISYPLDPGRYRIEMTADKDGASVTWVGATCTNVGQRSTYSGICEVSSQAQVVIENPTTFGLGSGIFVTVKLTKLRQ